MSVSKKYYDVILKNIKNIDFTLLSNNEIISIFQSIFSNILENFEVKEMYRMCKDTKLNIAYEYIDGIHRKNNIFKSR